LSGPPLNFTYHNQPTFEIFPVSTRTLLEYS
jgi:hypothetical protein